MVTSPETRALAVHDQQLAPVAGQFKQALIALDHAVQEKINSTATQSWSPHCGMGTGTWRA